MGDVIKLRQARKKLERQRGNIHAAAQRLSHGSTKADRWLDTARNEKVHRELDQHRVERGDER